jgi:uncharacterized protein
VGKQHKAYERALQVARRRQPDLARAFHLLTVAHRYGDGRATYALATWYLHGKHVDRNLKKATVLLRAAASKDIPDALFDLAVSYEKGIGVNRSERRAAELYLRCSLAGGSGGYFEVGRCYYYGIGFKRDRRLANLWFEFARRAKRKKKSG